MLSNTRVALKKVIKSFIKAVLNVINWQVTAFAIQGYFTSLSYSCHRQQTATFGI